MAIKENESIAVKNLWEIKAKGSCWIIKPDKVDKIIANPTGNPKNKNNRNIKISKILLIIIYHPFFCKYLLNREYTD